MFPYASFGADPPIVQPPLPMGDPALPAPTSTAPDTTNERFDLELRVRAVRRLQGELASAIASRAAPATISSIRGQLVTAINAERRALAALRAREIPPPPAPSMLASMLLLAGLTAPAWVTYIATRMA